MWTQHTKFAAPAKKEMQKHPECKDACQQSVAYATWPEHSCNPKCVWLTNPAPVGDCGEAGHDKGQCGNASCLKG